MRIGNVVIERNTPTKIIAELGTLNLSAHTSLMHATEEAFRAGADMVKVQLIDSKTAWWANKPQRSRYAELDKPISWWEDYFNACLVAFDKPVIASLFDESFLVLDTLVPAWKIGWKVNSMPGLIDAIFKKNKPVIWSQNGSEYWRQGLKSQLYHDRDQDSIFDESHPDFAREWATSWRINNYSNRSNVRRLFVQTIYPTPVDKQYMPSFAPGSEYAGLSHHGADLAMPCAAIACGAELVEVHVASKCASGPDTSFALDMKRLEKLSEMRYDFHDIFSLKDE